MSNCLYCYEPLEGVGDFHVKCSLAFFGTENPPVVPYGLSDMAELAKSVVGRSIAVPGVQPKLSLSLIKDAHKKEGGRLTVVGALGGNYILKPPTLEYPELPQNEHLTMRMAEGFGIRTVPSSLLRLQSGELAYITKRVDRTDSGEKIHMLDMFQVTEAFDKYKGSMEKTGKAIGLYSSNTLLDKLCFFEMALFSFLVGNNDMHLKNFSLTQSPTGWALAPAYDLLNVSITNPDDQEELALPIAGKKSKLERVHFEALATELGLTPKQTTGVFLRFKQNRTAAANWIENSFLSENMKQEYSKLMESRYVRMYP